MCLFVYVLNSPCLLNRMLSAVVYKHFSLSVLVASALRSCSVYFGSIPGTRIAEANGFGYVEFLISYIIFISN